MPQNRESKGTRLTGINPLAYMGVEPSTPPQLVVYQNSPTDRDINFNLGTLWVVETPFEVWMLVNKTPQNATKWILIYPQGDAGEATLFPTDDGTAEADAITHELNILGGDNMNTSAPGNINNIRINLNEFIIWPSTNNVGDQGVIYLGGERYFHNFGDLGLSDNNTFLGTQSGNFTLTGTNNTGIGAFALNALTSGDFNIAVSSQSLPNLTTGVNNIAIGFQALQNLDQGNTNIAIGVGAGSNYSAGETGNIILNNNGVTGEDATIRIGREGIQLAAHMAGINGITVAGTVTPNTLINVDDDGQLGQVLLTSLDNSITFTQTDNGHLDLSVVDGGDDGALTQDNFGTVFSKPFSYVQVADSANFVANPLLYAFGSSVILTSLYDMSAGAFFPGNGAGIPARFTAPATGKWQFIIALNAFNNVGGIQTILFEVVTPTRNYKQTLESPLPPATNTLWNGFSWVINVDLTLNDIVTFNATISYAGPQVRVMGNNDPGIGTILYINTTGISGFRIA